MNDDKPLPEDEAIKAAHPMRTNRHDLYQEAQRMVSAKCVATKRDTMLREALKNSRLMLHLCRSSVAMDCMPGIDVVVQGIDEALKY